MEEFECINSWFTTAVLVKRLCVNQFSVYSHNVLSSVLNVLNLIVCIGWLRVMGPSVDIIDAVYMRTLIHFNEEAHAHTRF